VNCFINKVYKQSVQIEDLFEEALWPLYLIYTKILV